MLKMFSTYIHSVQNQKKRWNIYFSVDGNRFEIYENDKRKTDFSFFLFWSVSNGIFLIRSNKYMCRGTTTHGSYINWKLWKVYLHFIFFSFLRIRMIEIWLEEVWCFRKIENCSTLVNEEENFYLVSCFNWSWF